jgi:hypothetical protein
MRQSNSLYRPTVDGGERPLSENQTWSHRATLNFPDTALMFFSRFHSVTSGRRRLLCRDGGVSLIDYAGFCFCFIALILAFTSFCTNAFGIALFAGKLIMAFVVA